MQSNETNFLPPLSMHFAQKVEQYLRHSTLHGTKFLVHEDTSRLERLFWTVCIAFAWFASWLLMSASLDAFENNPISFVVETSYRDWDTNFPAIIVCQSKNQDRIQQIAEKIWGSDHEFTLEEVLNEIAFFGGELYHTLQECTESEAPTENCIASNYSHYAQIVRSSCEESIENCFWNEEKFECCSHFQQIETELGSCYALNSIQVVNSLSSSRLNMYLNRHTGLGSLKMDLITEIYILGNEEVPTLVTPKTDILTVVGANIRYSRLILRRDINNDELIRSTSVEQRKCRFSDENTLEVHRRYSYSACLVQCRKNKQIELCNCSSHLTPNTPSWQLCNITGIECLNRNYEDLSVIIAQWSHERRGLVCDCLPSCTEVDITTVYDHWENMQNSEGPISKVEIAFSDLPTERYKRNLVRGKLDLIVSMGGTFGLFVGASLLSIVEFVYYFAVRPFAGRQ